MAGAYLHTEDERGFRYAPEETSAWSQFALPPLPDPPNDGWISAIAAAPDNSEKLYAVFVDDRYLRVSTNGGASWSRNVAFQPLQGTPPFGINAPATFNLLARPGGELFRLNQRNNDNTWNGFWRSLDDGDTWTRILPLPPAASNVGGGGYMALGTSKIWYAIKTRRGTSTVTHLWDIRRANFDGTGVETLASEALPGTLTSARMHVRAIDDTFALVIQNRTDVLWKVTATGKVDIRPPGLRPWDAVIVSSSTFVAAGEPIAGGTETLVYRTIDAGASWTLVKTIAAAEGFVEAGAEDSYRMIDASPPGRTDLVMPGNAAYNIQQILWTSSDAGLTWTKVLNAADPNDGEWLVFGPGGILARPTVAAPPLVATPSRLATIVG